jgi:hypothetical protein
MIVGGSNLKTVGGEDLLTEDEAAAMMDVDTAAVSRMRAAGQVIGLALEGGRVLFPAWQFTYDGQPFHDVSNVLASVGGDHDLAYGFLTASHPELGGLTAMEHMRRSRTENLGTLAARWMTHRST